MAPAGLVLMGRVSGAFGIRGEIRVFFYGQDPSVIARAKTVFLGPNPESAKPLEVQGLREHGGRVLISSPRVEQREQAAALAGAFVYLEQRFLPPLEQGEYYWYQLKGARVQDRQGRPLGTVKEVADLGAHDLLLVRSPQGHEALVPLVEDLVLAMDLEQGLITVDLPEGLLEAQGWPEGPPAGGEA